VVEINYIVFGLFLIPIILHYAPHIPKFKKTIISKNNARKKVKLKEVKMNKLFDKLTIFEVIINNQSGVEQNVTISSPTIKNLNGLQRSYSDGFICNKKINKKNIIDSLDSIVFGSEITLKKGLNNCAFIYQKPHLNFKKPFLLKTDLRFNEIGSFDKTLFSSNSYESHFNFDIEKMFE